VITVPKTTGCQFKHLELISLQDNTILVVLVLRGALVRQQLMNLEETLSQKDLSAISGKLNLAYAGLNTTQIEAQNLNLTSLEKQLSEIIIKTMKAEDRQEYDQSYLEGLHFLLNQPEFAHNQRVLGIMELLEHRALLGDILPKEISQEVCVVIGSENKAEVAHDCSLVISRYGLADEARGTIVVVGPTRMAYSRVISAVNYLTLILTGLVAEVYGINTIIRPDTENAS